MLCTASFLNLHNLIYNPFPVSWIWIIIEVLYFLRLYDRGSTAVHLKSLFNSKLFACKTSVKVSQIYSNKYLEKCHILFCFHSFKIQEMHEINENSLMCLCVYNIITYVSLYQNVCLCIRLISLLLFIC